MAATRKPRIQCPHCDTLAPAGRLDWNELTEAREWSGGEDYLDMGPHFWNTTPPLHYFRRVRRCSACDELIHTAEVEEDVLGELSRLREEVRELRERHRKAIAQVDVLRSELGA